MKTTQEMIAVMQAAVEGKKIESCNQDGEWLFIEGRAMRWNWEQCDYRVKPVEPRKIWVNTKTYYHSRMQAAEDTPCTQTILEFIELTPEIRKALNL